MADILISKFTTQIPRVGATPATPGFAESEGQDPVTPSGTPQVYTPVTIGSPANGLSISGTQVLTIGLASTSATGALSSTDWNTFNGKIGGSIASGQVAFGSGAGTISGNDDFRWDDSVKRLGISASSFFGIINETSTDYLRVLSSISGVITLGVGAAGTGDPLGYQLFTRGSAATPVLTILNTGAAGFGTNSPTNTVDINGTLRIRSISSGSGNLLNYSATGVVTGSLIFDNTNSIGIGTSNPTFFSGRTLSIASPATTLRGIAFKRADTNANTAVIYSEDGGLLMESAVVDIAGFGGRIRMAAGGLIGLNTTSPTNTLDVNGTARIRTINNLGSAATSVLVPSATGVVSLRTLAELSADMGNTWTSVGTGNIFRNSRISVGHTADPTESIDLGASGWIRTGQGASNAGGVILPFTSANANSRSWTFRNDAGAFGEIGLTVSATQAGDPKTGNLIFRLTNIGNIGINGAPDAFSNYRYFSLYGASTTLGGVFIAKTSNSSHTFQLRVDSTANHLQALNNPMIFYCGTGGAERMRITNNGNLLINTTTDLGYKLYNVGTTGLDGNITLIDTTGTNIVFGTTTGSQIGTATNQKLAFYGSTPIVKPSGDILTALSNLGLITSPTITQVDQFAVKTTASADQTLPSGTLTILDYDTTLLNNSTATYTVGTNGRITINTTGIYTITAGVVIEADAVTALESAFLGIFRNGDLVAISSINTTIAAGAQSGLSTSTILSLTATDIIDCRALVNSVGGVANGLARRLGTLLGANATQVNSLSITKNSM